MQDAMMSLSMEEREAERGESVGGILMKVQNDLKYLKEQLLAQTRTGDRSSLDYSVLEDAIARTERGLKLQADNVVHLANNQVTLLPIHQSQATPEHITSVQRSRHLEYSKAKTSLSSSLSPGQEVQLRLIGQLLNQPTHPTTRRLLHDAYKVEAPQQGRRRRSAGRVHGQRAVGTTVAPLTRLPQANRRDALLSPPPISTIDVQKGLLSLLERGLIPRTAEIVIDPPLVQPSSKMLHSFSSIYDKPLPADGTETGAALVGVKFDPTIFPSLKADQSVAPLKQADYTLAQQKAPPVVEKTVHLPSAEREGKEQHDESGSKTQEKNHQLILTVRNGTVVKNEEYTSFKLSVESKWTIVLDIIHHIESVGKQYAIPIIFLNGQKTFQLAEEYVLEPHPSLWEVMRCVYNRRDVEHLLRLPGRRYKGQGGLHAAAAKIQATFRMYSQRLTYLEYRRKQWASRVIAMAWLLYVKARNVRQLLERVRAEHITNYRTRLKSLGSRWSEVQQNHRVVIHLPSKGYPDYIRGREKQFHLRQGLQMVRVSDALDPMVEVIYVSPLPITEEIQHYYKQLLSMAEGGEGAWQRVHIVTPEHANSFQHRNLNLAALLKYSPRSIARIQRLIGGRTAYLVSEYTSREDLEVADKLDVPVLGAEPQLIELYSTHSGRSKLFADADVTMPPSAEDVCSLEQLIDLLASLITAHLTVRRWLFKIDHFPHGKGFAYCDVADHLQCYQSALRKRERYGKKWGKLWARESSRQRVISELPAILAVHATPVDKTMFPSWSQYLQAFLKSGGSIEATPPSDGITTISVDLLLSPDGSYSLLSTSDVIHSSPYTVWGGSTPQSSVDQSQLTAVVSRTAHAAQSRGILGYLSVELLTFINPETMCQELWAVDIDFGPSDIWVMARTMSGITNVKFNPATGQLVVGGKEDERRYAVLSCHLWHSNLSIVQHDVFFRMCKSHLIGYHPKTSTGALFSLVEGSQRQRMGMICLQPTLSQVLNYSSSTLATIHQEITTPHIQGSSNLPAVYREMESVAALVAENEQELLKPIQMPV